MAGMALSSESERSESADPGERSASPAAVTDPIAGFCPVAPLSPAMALGLQRRAGNRAVVQLVQRDQAPPPTDAQGKQKPESRTAYIGFNPDSGQEAAKLTAKLGKRAMISLYDADERANLAKPEDITWFVGVELGIPIGTDQFKVLETLFNTLNQDSRAHLADLAKMLAGAENDEYVLDRLILSGHSDGVVVWGEDRDNFHPGGILVERDLAALAQAFPKGAGEIKHVMFSACYTIAAVNLVTKIFTGVEDVWSYSGSSPDVAGGSAGHILSWELDTADGKGLKKGEQLGTAALWTRSGGFIVGDPKSADFGQQWSTFRREWSEVVVPEAQGKQELNHERLNQIYSHLQHLLADPQINHQQQAEALSGKDRLVRLRYWEKVRANFAQKRADLIKAAYAEIGLPVPDFATMTRKQFRDAEDAFKTALEAKGSPASAKKFYDEQLEGMWNLKPEAVPNEWV
jgi:hypothetical protein